jgi:hypothetical protein
MKGDCIATNSVDEEEVSSQMALRKARPVHAALAEAMLAESLRQFSAIDHHIEDVLQRFRFEFWMFASSTVVALEARQDN